MSWSPSGRTGAGPRPPRTSCQAPSARSKTAFRDVAAGSGYLQYAHPIFEVFAGPRSGDFSGARFYRARQLFEPSDSAEVVARFDDGSVAMAELRYRSREGGGCG